LNYTRLGGEVGYAEWRSVTFTTRGNKSKLAKHEHEVEIKLIKGTKQLSGNKKITWTAVLRNA
jgi:hypothetical protein